MDTVTYLEDMSTRIHPAIDELAHAVVADGVAAHAAALNQLVAVAYAAGVSTTLIGIVGDRTQPEVARLRALGRILAALESPSEPRAATSTTAAA
jgi:hypothetical protein